MKNYESLNGIFKLFCICGVICVLFYLLHDIVGALNYPGYSWLSQAVSDLTATDAPSFPIASIFSSIYGILSCICCLSLCFLIRKEKIKSFKYGIYLFTLMSIISAVGFALFPLSSAGFDGTFQSWIHVYIITSLVVILSIISLILIALGSIKKNEKLLGSLAILALVLMFVGAIGSGIVPKSYFGLIERFSTYSAVIFTGILGIFGFTKF